MGKKHRNRINSPKKIIIYRKKPLLLNTKHMAKKCLLEKERTKKAGVTKNSHTCFFNLHIC